MMPTAPAIIMKPLLHQAWCHAAEHACMVHTCASTSPPPAAASQTCVCAAVGSEKPCEAMYCSATGGRCASAGAAALPTGCCVAAVAAASFVAGVPRDGTAVDMRILPAAAPARFNFFVAAFRAAALGARSEGSACAAAMPSACCNAVFVLSKGTVARRRLVRWLSRILGLRAEGSSSACACERRQCAVGCPCSGRGGMEPAIRTWHSAANEILYDYALPMNSAKCGKHAPSTFSDPRKSGWVLLGS